jgi:hypothetical protein
MSQGKRKTVRDARLGYGRPSIPLETAFHAVPEFVFFAA